MLVKIIKYLHSHMSYNSFLAAFIFNPLVLLKKLYTHIHIHWNELRNTNKNVGLIKRPAILPTRPNRNVRRNRETSGKQHDIW